MNTPEKQIGKPEDDFQTEAMMQSIEEMKDCKKKISIASIIEYISAKKYIPRTKGAESIIEAKRHKRAKEGNRSVIARSETYMDTKPHENFMTELQDGEKKQRIRDVLNNISKITFTPSGDWCRGGEKYSKQVEDVCTKGESDCWYEIPQALNLRKKDLNKAYVEWMEIARTLERIRCGNILVFIGYQDPKKDFEKLDTYDGIKKVIDPVKKTAIISALKYIENHKYTLMTNGAQYYFKFMENLFETLKQTNGFVTPIELRMQVAATQFCKCENEGILMYGIYKNWVEKHLSDDDRMREQDWIDFKQHWNESLQDMYHENKRLKEKAEAGDKPAKQMEKRKLKGMVNKIRNLKFCPKKGAECYFRESDALWEETHTKCDYDVPEEICMQKATCAILIAKLTNLANLEWWNRMGFIEREDVWEAFKFHWTCRLEKIKVEKNTKDWADDVVGDFGGDENKDETNPFFNANWDDSDIDNSEKENDGRDEMKAPHGWNKARKSCADKKATKNQFQKEINRLTVASLLKLAKEEDNGRSTFYEETIRQQIIDQLDHGRRSIKPIALDTPIAISPSKDHITSSPDYIYFRVYTPCDTISSRTYRRPSFDRAKHQKPTDYNYH
eukprot:jgi/Psemu1/51713/gm1.51713_g